MTEMKGILESGGLRDLGYCPILCGKLAGGEIEPHVPDVAHGRNSKFRFEDDMELSR